MILPNKHITISQSLLGLGGYILTILESPQTIDELWLYLEKTLGSSKFPTKHTFENMILALDFLYVIRAIDYTSEGKINLCA